MKLFVLCQTVTNGEQKSEHFARSLEWCGKGMSRSGWDIEWTADLNEAFLFRDTKDVPELKDGDQGQYHFAYTVVPVQIRIFDEPDP